jgi:hypothetical protein
MVESALVAPALLALFFGFAEYANYELELDAATSASRDAARVATVHHHVADLPTDVAAMSACSSGFDDYDRVCREARARLVGVELAATGSTAPIVVRCYDDLGTTAPVPPVVSGSPGGCAAAQGGEDTVEVTMRWRYRPQTPIGQLFLAPKILTSTSRMVTG